MMKKILVTAVIVIIVAGASLTQLLKQEPKVLNYLGCDWVVPKEFEQVNQGRYVKAEVSPQIL